MNVKSENKLSNRYEYLEENRVTTTYQHMTSYHLVENKYSDGCSHERLHFCSSW